MPGAGLDSSLGAIFIALIVSGALWGVSCSQVSQYFSSRYNDPLWLRIMVFAVWAADTVHQGVITQSFYEYAVTDFGDLTLLEFTPRTSTAQILVTQFLVTLVQGFYTFKIWKLSERTLYIRPFYMVAFVCVLIVAELAMSIADAVADAKSHTWVALLANSYVYNIAYSALACAIDVVLTAMMIFLLQRNRTELSKTNGIINRVTTLVLATNFLTTICSTAILVSTIAAPHTLYIIPLFQVDTRLYTVSFLAALNLRDFLAHGWKDRQFVFDMSSFRAAPRMSSSTSPAPATPASAKALGPWSARVSTDELDTHVTVADPI